MEAKKKFNVKKFVRIFSIVLLVIWVVATVSLSFAVYSANIILTQESEVNEDFWRLKMSIAKCYLSEKKGFFDDKEIYKKKLYSSDCEVDTVKVKWIATKIELKDASSNYEGYIGLGRKEKIPIRITDATLQQVIDGQEHGSDEIIIYSEPNLQMYYSVDDEIFKVEYATN